MVVEGTHNSHASHRPDEKGCAKQVRCVKSVPKAAQDNGLEKACDPQGT